VQPVCRQRQVRGYKPSAAGAAKKFPELFLEISFLNRLNFLPQMQK
jgi:hypothetical protein